MTPMYSDVLHAPLGWDNLSQVLAIISSESHSIQSHGKIKRFGQVMILSYWFLLSFHFEFCSLQAFHTLSLQDKGVTPRHIKAHLGHFDFSFQDVYWGYQGSYRTKRTEETKIHQLPMGHVRQTASRKATADEARHSTYFLWCSW